MVQSLILFIILVAFLYILFRKKKKKVFSKFLEDNYQNKSDQINSDSINNQDKFIIDLSLVNKKKMFLLIGMIVLFIIISFLFLFFSAKSSSNNGLYHSVINKYDSILNPAINVKPNYIDSLTLLKLKKDTSYMKYGVKSGYIKQRVSLNENDFIFKIYFKEYGRISATYFLFDNTKLNTLLNKSNKSITFNDSCFKIDYDKRAVTVTNSLYGDQFLDVRFIRPLANQPKLSDVGISECCTEQYLNYKCKKYLLDNKKLNVHGTYHVFKGIILNANIQHSTGRFLIQNLELDTLTLINDTVFSLPTSNFSYTFNCH